jgi:hypothetical protein
MANTPNEETYSPEETERRAAAALKRMLQTPTSHIRRGRSLAPELLTPDLLGHVVHVCGELLKHPDDVAQLIDN